MKLNKPNDWMTVDAIRNDKRKQLPAGNYPCIITAVEEDKDFNKCHALRIVVDICDGEHAGYFAAAKNNYNNSIKISTGCDLLTSQNAENVQKNKGRFKGFLEMLAETNPTFRWNWETDSLKGLRLCGQFGEVEFISKQTGNVCKGTQLRFVAPLAGSEELPIVAPKLLKNRGSAGGGNDSFDNPFTDVPAPSDDDIPF